MENIDILLPVYTPVITKPEDKSLNAKRSSFIEANTEIVSFEELKHNHLIPVFARTNDSLISHSEFIEAVFMQVADVFHGERILNPEIRVSHPIKGRIPDAKDKSAATLEEWESTLYFERMAFVIEVPSIQTIVDGNTLSLTIGGVKAYNSDNLYSRNVSEQLFKVFVGYQNKVCTNLCVWSDGVMDDIKVNNTGQLSASVRTLLDGYNKNFHLDQLARLANYSITEKQFAQIIGKCRMYNHLPTDLKKGIPAILFGDHQLGTVVKDYFKDESFCRDSSGNINLWRLYNLFTGANKSSYIDSFLDRSVNAFNLVEQIRRGLEGKIENWYLN